MPAVQAEIVDKEDAPKAVGRATKPGLDVLASALKSNRVIPRPRDGLVMFRAVMSSPMEHLTEEFISQMYLLVSVGHYPETAAASLGIPSQVWKRWWEMGQKLIATLENQPDLIHMMSEDEANILMLVQNVVAAMMEAEMEALEKIKAAGNFDWAALAWWLAKMHPEKYGKLREMPKNGAAQQQIGPNSGVLAVGEAQPVEQWLESNQDRDLATLPKQEPESV